MSKQFDLIKKTDNTKTAKPIPCKSSTDRGMGAWGLILTITGIGLLVYSFLATTSQNTYAPESIKVLPSPTRTSPLITPTIVTMPSEIAPTSTATLIKNYTIQVYDAGIGEASAKRFVDTLVAQGYTAQYLGASQLVRNSSSISYREGLSVVANEIAKFIPGEPPQTVQSQISGVFDVIIWLGKK